MRLRANGGLVGFIHLCFKVSLMNHSVHDEAFEVLSTTDFASMTLSSSPGGIWQRIKSYEAPSLLKTQRKGCIDISAVHSQFNSDTR